MPDEVSELVGTSEEAGAVFWLVQEESIKRRSKTAAITTAKAVFFKIITPFCF